MPSRETSHSNEQRWQVHENDRDDLLCQAQRLVFTFTVKTTPGLLRESMAPGEPLDDVERGAYHAALRCLQREFDHGPRPAESHLTESSVETRESRDGDDSGPDNGGDGKAEARANAGHDGDRDDEKHRRPKQRAKGVRPR